MKKILITGASSHVAKNIVDDLNKNTNLHWGIIKIL